MTALPQSPFLFCLLLTILFIGIELISCQSSVNNERASWNVETKQDFMDTTHHLGGLPSKMKFNVAVNPVNTNPELNQLLLLGGLLEAKQKQQNNNISPKVIGNQLAVNLVKNLLGGFGGSSDAFGQSLQNNDLLQSIIYLSLLKNILENLNVGMPLTSRKNFPTLGNNFPTLGNNLLGNEARDLNTLSSVLNIINSKANTMNTNKPLSGNSLPLVQNLGVLPISDNLLSARYVEPANEHGNEDFSQILNIIGALERRDL